MAILGRLGKVYVGFCFIRTPQWVREVGNSKENQRLTDRAMILTSPDKQFSLHPDGQIFFQPDPTNPLPGVAVARIVKGESLLKPSAELLDKSMFEGQDTDVITAKLNEWLGTSIHLSLESLFRLIAGDDHTDASRTIAESVFESLGIVSRDTLHDDIAKLDEEGRKALRARKVRMGPIIIYMPDLNKPAAIKLRALLLTLWNNGALPAQTPPDGMVSMPIEGKDIDPDFYSKIGYPVYGPRAIRVDMLDRVICAIYDTADKGIFQAQHKMAEWLGCNISDLYAVLEAMGHTKASDPIVEKVKAEEQGDAVVALAAPVTEEASTEAVAEETAKPAPAAKPELATFRLKRNKPVTAREDRPKKPFKKFDDKNKDAGEKKKFKGKPKDKDRKPRDERERVFSAKAQSKPEDNPFAILQQLKMGNDK